MGREMGSSNLIGWVAKLYVGLLVIAGVVLLAWAANRYLTAYTDRSMLGGIVAGAAVLVVFLLVIRRVART